VTGATRHRGYFAAAEVWVAAAAARIAATVASGCGIMLGCERDMRFRALRHHHLQGRWNDVVRVADDIPRWDRLPTFGGRCFLVKRRTGDRALSRRHHRRHRRRNVRREDRPTILLSEIDVGISAGGEWDGSEKIFDRRGVRSQQTKRAFAFVRREGMDLNEGLDVRIGEARRVVDRQTPIFPAHPAGVALAGPVAADPMTDPTELAELFDVDGEDLARMVALLTAHGLGWLEPGKAHP
jgi:hypothetical protein